MNKMQTLHHETAVRRPVGTFASVATLLVIVLNQLGLDITVDEAVAVLGGLTALLSVFHPKL